jgi:hypothetical protein
MFDFNQAVMFGYDGAAMICFDCDVHDISRRRPKQTRTNT